MTSSFILIIFSAFIFGCTSISEPSRKPSSTSSQLNANPPSSTPEWCAAIRGNGPRMAALFSALGEFTEKYGPLRAIAASSSGSIVAFLYESMSLNPALQKCEDHLCEPHERRARLALLLKSFRGYFTALKQTNDLGPIVEFVITESNLSPEDQKKLDDFKNHMKERWPREMIEKRLKEIKNMARILRQLVTHEKTRQLFNPEIAKRLSPFQNPYQLYLNVRQLMDSLASLQSLSNTNADILLRPSLINISELTRRIGIMGNFYAGRGHADLTAWQDFFHQCAQNPELGWQEIAMQNKDSISCGSLFNQMVINYRNNNVVSLSDSRELDLIGSYISTFVSTSALQRPGLVSEWKNAQNLYLSGEHIPFSPGLKYLRVGVWGNKQDLQLLSENKKGFDDFKSRSLLNLGQVPWAKAMIPSISEPGYSPAIVYDENQDILTTGGWLDGHATLQLLNIGCEKVVYFTRADVDSKFGQSVAQLLKNPKDPADDLIFDSIFKTPHSEDEKKSAFRLSSEAADLIWCANWNQIPNFNFDDLTEDARHPLLIEPKKPSHLRIKGTDVPFLCDELLINTEEYKPTH